MVSSAGFEPAAYITIGVPVLETGDLSHLSTKNYITTGFWFPEPKIGGSRTLPKQ